MSYERPWALRFGDARGGNLARFLFQQIGILVYVADDVNMIARDVRAHRVNKFGPLFALAPRLSANVEVQK
jgi:hypothetical protein